MDDKNKITGLRLNGELTQASVPDKTKTKDYIYSELSKRGSFYDT